MSTMSREELALALLRIAGLDLKASKILFDNGLYPQAIFYAQQCCEKAYKAFLVFVGLAKEGEDLSKSISHYPFSKGLQLLVDRAVKELVELIEERGIDEKSFEKVLEPYLEFPQVSSLTSFVENLKRKIEVLVTSAIGELSAEKLCKPLTKDTEEQIDEIIDIITTILLDVETFLESIKLGPIIYRLLKLLHVSEAKLRAKLDEVSWLISRPLLLAETALYVFLIASVFLERYAVASRYPGKIDPSKDIKHNSIITKIARDFINYIVKTRLLRRIHELIRGDVTDEELKEILKAHKELIKTQIKLHIETNKLGSYKQGVAD